MKMPFKDLLLPILSITVCYLMGCSHPAIAPAPLSPSGYRVKTIYSRIGPVGQYFYDTINFVYDAAGRVYTVRSLINDIETTNDISGSNITITQYSHNNRAAEGTLDTNGHVTFLLGPDDVYGPAVARPTANFIYDSNGFLTQQSVTDTVHSRSAIYYYNWTDSCLTSIYRDSVCIARYSYTTTPEH